MTKPSFTGRQRRRVTTRSVVWTDRIAKTVITFGGIGTILAVLLVCVFLISVVVPLFGSADVSASTRLAAAATTVDGTRPSTVVIDEYQTLGWAMYPDTRLVVFRADDGEPLARRQLFERDLPVSSSIAPDAKAGDAHDAVFGFADGTVRRVVIAFRTTYLEPESMPQQLRDIPLGGRAVHEEGVFERTPGGQFRLQQVVTTIEDPLKSGTDQPVLLVDQSERPEGSLLAMLTADGRLRIESVSETEDLMSDEITREARLRGTIEIERHNGEWPSRLMLSGVGDSVYLIWRDGRLQRIDTRDLDAPSIVDVVDVVPDDTAELTAATFLVGKATLITGDSAGNLRAWFRVKPKTGTVSPDGTQFELVHELPSTGAAVRALAVSSRGRVIIAAFADGVVRVLQVTSHKQIVEVQSDPTDVHAVAMAPKEDGFYVLAGDNFVRYAVTMAHPETSIAAIFRPIWYEGYEKPGHHWESSSGTDMFEPKFGLIPLIFGTLKSTLYCMLFGVPLALLAAIYTSEFLNPKVKAKVKPTIELMASLPSVVLGFLAALVFAPFVEDHLITILPSIFTVPLSFLLFAYAWQLLPSQIALGLARWKFPLAFLAIPVGIGLGAVVGPAIETWCFAGDLRKWLSSGPLHDLEPRSHGLQGFFWTSAWMFLLLPLVIFLALIAVGRPLIAALLPRGKAIPRSQQATAELLKFGVLFVVVVGLALAGGWLLWEIGPDPRTLFLGTYVQRNSLIVGLVMGFAVIPIIYTIAEDALSSVPEHLRAASLGAGATQWQTAVRVIIPTAMSGLFSAVMVGFGRAVGETMIVLMATGNTPVMEWNVFNGVRTLSANIAVELPEAVRDSTHYRMLFFAALTLFVLTFAVNTIAEVVRQRFRKRAYQL